MMNIPILKHISEALNLEVRVFHRDENTDLIDQYLTNGTARSIPIFVFLNDNFEQVSVWGPRAKQVQTFCRRNACKVTTKDDPTYEDKSAETHVIISNRYKTDSQMWKHVYDSILDKLITI